LGLEGGFKLTLRLASISGGMMVAVMAEAAI
jgi:hypothetical protein